MQGKCRQVNALFWCLHIIKNLMVDETGFKLEEPKADETAVDKPGPHLGHMSDLYTLHLSFNQTNSIVYY